MLLSTKQDVAVRYSPSAADLVGGLPRPLISVNYEGLRGGFWPIPQPKTGPGGFPGVFPTSQSAPLDETTGRGGF